MSWKIRDSLSNVLFAYCFPPMALFIHSPRGKGRDTTAHKAGRGRGASGRVLPGARGSPRSQPLLPACPRLLGQSRPLRGARSLRGPVGFVAVPSSCPALKESLHPRPAKPAPARHHRPCTVATFPAVSLCHGAGRAARLAPQAGHGRSART